MKKRMLLAKFESMTENANGILLGGFLPISTMTHASNNCTSTNKGCTASPTANNCNGTNCWQACGN